MATSVPWAAVVLEVPSLLEDEIAGVLGRESLGVEVAPGGEGRSRLKVYVASLRDASGLLSSLEAPLGTWGLDRGRCAARLEPVEDLHWVERYQERLRPFPIGERFVVVPHGDPPAGGTRTPIRLVPGRAFGTGEHATTRLCVDAMERWVKPGSRWLDLGCGSAILSVVACRLGAARVEARDVDPEAVGVAEEVLRANGADRGVTLRAGSWEGLVPGSLDGIVANIATAFFLSGTTDLATTLADGGVLIASGFLGEETAAVAAAVESAGFQVVESRHEGDWGALVAHRGRKLVGSS